MLYIALEMEGPPFTDKDNYSLICQCKENAAPLWLSRTGLPQADPGCSLLTARDVVNR